ncbi:glycosyltransferase family A protein [Halomonas sp. TG39a]|uniref:glycosyltransferase family A protein n=1 Tax=Halomonas sp. TG39a TaxID=1415755 RepID=UPI003FA58E23
MPVHNKAATLLDSLACLYNQTFKNFEIIVVDDASTDGSLQILLQEERKGKLRLYHRDKPGPVILPSNDGHLKNVIHCSEVDHGKIDDINEEKILYPLLRSLPARSVSTR